MLLGSVCIWLLVLKQGEKKSWGEQRKRLLARKGNKHSSTCMINSISAIQIIQNKKVKAALIFIVSSVANRRGHWSKRSKTKVEFVKRRAVILDYRNELKLYSVLIGRCLGCSYFFLRDFSVTAINHLQNWPLLHVTGQRTHYICKGISHS